METGHRVLVDRHRKRQRIGAEQKKKTHTRSPREALGLLSHLAGETFKKNQACYNL